MKLLRIALFLSLGHLVASISLSVPTGDVVQSTSVDCQWTADATDPAAFVLVMQFSNASSLFGELAAVTTVQRGTTTNGTVPNIKNVTVLGMHRLAVYADPFDPNSQPSALSPVYNVVVPTIALSVPTTDVAVGTSVNCQWTSGATDPATFSLVMQFSNSGSPQFGDLAAVTVVRRGTTTSGTVPNIKSVAVLGMHRLAAYPDPFDSSAPGQPFSVSMAFNVIANSSQSFPTTGVVGAPTCVGCGRIELDLKPVF
ncbi:hypothetical protein B0H14DRAFT_361621 [Mycena olivaceomarginata]|nr:hypothetical protein B0H14DRAFT_361621 [Mycena olivaceomarginata]